MNVGPEEFPKYLGKYDWRPSDPTESCVRFHDSASSDLLAGKPYEDFLCLYPWLDKFYMQWEKEWRPVQVFEYLTNNHWIPCVCVILYGVMIVGGQAYMKERKPWNLRYSLMAWNLALALFSMMGFVRVLPTVVHVLTHYSLPENICYDPHIHTGHNEGGIWIVFFSLSKIAELLDTFFIIVNKKPLILLHWYHHLSVLLYCWFFLIYTAPTGIYFCLINYGVHSVMYMYYFLMAAKMKPKWMKPKVITIMQILQMVIGCTVTVYGYMLNPLGKHPNCYTKPFNAFPTFALYLSYFLLFSKFYYSRYVIKATHKEKKL